MAQNQFKLPKTLLFSVVLILLVISFFISIGNGQFPISFNEIIAILTGADVRDITARVFFQLRLPRTIMAMMAGIGLGIAGNIYQTIFKNPLASPDIIGVSPGATLGAAVSIVLLGSSTLTIASGAFIGGIVVVLFVLLLVRLSPSNTMATYVLAGIVMGSIARAFIMTLKYFADPTHELAAIEFWTMGSLASVTATKVLTILPLFGLSLLGVILLRRQIDLLSLGEDEARMLGVPLSQVRLLVLGLSTLLVASVISITGLIGFIGLVSPHIAKMMHKRNNFATTILSGLLGAIIMLLSDTLARSLLQTEIPISILTSLIGVPVLVYYMFRQKEIRS